MEKIISLLWMIRYISCLLTHLHSGLILVHSGVCTSLLRHNDVDTSMTLDAAKWNSTGVELSHVLTIFSLNIYYY